MNGNWRSCRFRWSSGSCCEWTGDSVVVLQTGTQFKPSLATTEPFSVWKDGWAAVVKGRWEAYTLKPTPGSRCTSVCVYDAVCRKSPLCPTSSVSQSCTAWTSFHRLQQVCDKHSIQMVHNKSQSFETPAKFSHLHNSAHICHLWRGFTDKLSSCLFSFCGFLWIMNGQSNQVLCDSRLGKLYIGFI